MIGTPLHVRRTREQVKRLVVLAAIVTFWSASWLFLAWRASRVNETECTVVELPGSVYCTVRHAADGEQHELAWQSCDSPTRTPTINGQPAAVGSRLRCFYYRSWPANIFFEPREHRWFTPLPAIALVLSLGLIGEGVRRRLSVAHADIAVGPTTNNPYRAPATVPSERQPQRSPLEIPLVESHWGKWIVGGMFFVLGIVLLSLSVVLVWGHGGELGLGELALLALGHSVTTAGAIGLFYRSGLVLDANQALIVSWWGLKRPWFRTYFALDALTHATAITEQGTPRARAHCLVLHFTDGPPRRYRRISHEDAAAAASRIEQYRRDALTPARTVW